MLLDLMRISIVPKSAILFVDGVTNPREALISINMSNMLP